MAPPGQPLTPQNEGRPELRGASPVLRVVMDQGTERAVVNFVMDAVAGARRTLSLSLSLSVAFNVLGLRFTPPEALRRRFLRAVAAAVFFVHVAAATSALCRGTSQQNFAFQFCPTVAAAVIFDCEEIAAPHVPAVAAAAVYDCKDVAASLMPSVAAVASHASARHVVLHFVTGLMIGGQPSPTGCKHRDSLLRGHCTRGPFGTFRRAPLS